MKYLTFNFLKVLLEPVTMLTFWLTFDKIICTEKLQICYWHQSSLASIFFLKNIQQQVTITKEVDIFSIRTFFS